MPTSARDRAGGGRVVAGEQHRRAGRGRAARATASAERRLDGVGDDEHGRGPRRPSRRRHGGAAAASASVGRAASSSGAVGPTRRAASRSRPATARLPSTTPATPSPRGSSNAARPRGELRVAAARDRPARSDAPRRASSAPASRSTSSSVRRRRRDDVDERHPPGRHRAGLVEHDGVDAAGRLEHLGALDQDAELGAAAGADQQRGRRGQPERARAGDDQHGDGGA